MQVTGCMGSLVDAIDRNDDDDDSKRRGDGSISLSSAMLLAFLPSPLRPILFGNLPLHCCPGGSLSLFSRRERERISSSLPSALLYRIPRLVSTSTPAVRSCAIPLCISLRVPPNDLVLSSERTKSLIGLSAGGGGGGQTFLLLALMMNSLPEYITERHRERGCW